MTGKQVLAMDIGGTHTRIALSDEQGNLSGYRNIPTISWAETHPLTSLSRVIESFLEDNALKSVDALSLGFPSAVDKARRTLISTPAVPALDGIAIADRLAERFPCPVFIDRDVVMLFAHAEHVLHLPREGVTLAFFIGTGIGNVICLNGEVFNGANGIAGELGHIPLPGKNDPCGCGGRGCAELYAAGRALATIRKRYFPQDKFEDLFVCHRNSKSLSIYMDTLARVLAAEMVILDPDRVLLGGGVIHMPGFPIDELIEKIKPLLRSRDSAQRLQFLTAPDAQHAGVIGAGLYAFSKFKEDNVQ